MTSELKILTKIKELIIREYSNYKEADDNTVLNDKNVVIDLCDPDKMTDDVGVWIDTRGVDVNDYTMEEDNLSMSVRLSIICKRDESTKLRNKVFNIKSAIYRILRNNQSLDNTVDLITIDNYTYYPQLFLEIGIVGMDIDVTVDYVENW